MRQHLAIALCVFMPLAAHAEEDRGLSLMERGAQLFMEGILKEMEPAMDDFSGMAEQIGPGLRGFVQEMGPKLRDILGQVEDWSVYEAPEILPNGDIIIRRKPELLIIEPPEETPQIDL